MKKYYILLIAALAALGCDTLDTMTDIYTTQYHLDNQASSVIQVGYAPYGYLVNGFSELDNNIAAAKSDEAAMTSLNTSVRYFNNGSWNAYNNPDNPYNNFYKGIRAANYYLDYSVEYKKMLAVARDTLSDSGTAYRRDVENAAYLRAEAHVLKAYYYFELLKRYGDVPLYKEVMTENIFLPKSSYAEVAGYAVGEIDSALEDLAPNWNANVSYAGRFDKGAAMALKSRILLYAASPLNTESFSADEKQAAWEDAAKAAADVIALNTYSLSSDYESLFKGNTSSNKEIIMARSSSANNTLEKANYPIGTAGGNSGLTPSGNLVDAYEYIAAPDPANPFAGRDPRLGFTIATHGSEWNGRTIDVSEGGSDSYHATNASRTGYYLKKYLTDNLVLSQNQTAMHHWIYFRYAEILLNFAEAANEAYGPDQVDATAGISAREALDMVRGRTSVGLPPVDLSKFDGSSDKERMRAAVKAERRVELAFEDHRYWDLLRWKDGEQLGKEITGIKAVKISEGVYSFEKTKVEDRVFESKMYRYPIPFQEISKSKGVLVQNIGW